MDTWEQLGRTTKQRQRGGQEESLSERPPLDQVRRGDSEVLLLVVCLAREEIAARGLGQGVKWRQRVVGGGHAFLFLAAAAPVSYTHLTLPTSYAV